MTRAKTDCFAYKPGQQKPPRRKAECMALDKLYCKEGECERFFRRDMGMYSDLDGESIIRAIREKVDQEMRH